MVLRFALLALAAVLSQRGASSSEALSTDTPKPEPGPSCASWSGTVSGNDPSVAIAGTLCEDAKGNVTGQFTWSSDRSGTNVRKVDGAWSSDHTSLTLRDGAIIDSHPKPGWRFCVVDQYDLTGSKDALTGRYHSSGCNDHAAMTLTRAN